MKHIVMWFWQLPQNLLAVLLILVTRAKKHHQFDNVKFYVLSRAHFGISLGMFVLLGSQYDTMLQMHEYGHAVQSRMLGWLYLPVIGLPSATRNIMARWNLMRGNWTHEKASLWYYSGYPENWADRLGNVDR